MFSYGYKDFEDKIDVAVMFSILNNFNTISNLHTKSIFQILPDGLTRLIKRKGVRLTTFNPYSTCNSGSHREAFQLCSAKLFACQ